MKRQVLFTVLALMTCVVAQSHAGVQSPRDAESPPGILEQGGLPYTWHQIAYRELKIGGIVQELSTSGTPFCLTMHIGTSERNAYLAKNHLKREEVLGAYPGELSFIASMTFQLGERTFTCDQKALIDVVNPKVESIIVNAYDHKFLISFNGPDAAESYICQFHIGNDGFLKRVTSVWVGGKGYQPVRELDLTK